ncbi:MAG: endo alpha-1,4 polygalactosaminidase [Solirubrobacterales bacterium]
MRSSVRPSARLGTLVAVAAIAAGTIAFAAAPEGGGAGEQPRSFAFAIGNGMLAGGAPEVAERLGEFDLVVVDGELARVEEVEALRGRGAIVLAYLSVGTIEEWRSWYGRLKRFRLRAWQDWKDEWFADVSLGKLRHALARRIAPEILAKGFDGLFLDNVDMIETRNHRAQRPGMRKLVRALAELVHADERLLFAQNGAWGLRRLGLVDALDGWNREDVTWTFDFDRRRYVRNPERRTRAALAELRRMAELGKLVTATDYTRARDLAARDEAVANACSAGALPYVSDIGLTARRLPRPPLACP